LIWDLSPRSLPGLSQYDGPLHIWRGASRSRCTTQLKSMHPQPAKHDVTARSQPDMSGRRFGAQGSGFRVWGLGLRVSMGTTRTQTTHCSHQPADAASFFAISFAKACVSDTGYAKTEQLRTPARVAHRPQQTDCDPKLQGRRHEPVGWKLNQAKTTWPLASWSLLLGSAALVGGPFRAGASPAGPKKTICVGPGLDF
jgi:hypothetical protein